MGLLNSGNKADPLKDRIARLRTVIGYNPDTGVFVWRTKRANKRVGDVAGNVGPNGYRTIMVDYQSYYAHHLAWAFVYGVVPAGRYIDHINGQRADNRISNLRLATNSQNLLNRHRLNKNNTSGAIGVSFDRTRKKWCAYIDKDYKRINLGAFDTKAQAIQARQVAHARIAIW